MLMMSIGTCNFGLQKSLAVSPIPGGYRRAF